MPRACCWRLGRTAQPRRRRLRGQPNGALWYPPDLHLREIPGEWRAEEGWPPSGQQPKTYFLNADHSLGTEPGEPARHELAYRPAATQEGGGPDFWWGDIWGDQRSVDAYSLTLVTGAGMAGAQQPAATLNLSSNVSGKDWITRRDPARQQGSVEWHGGDVNDYPWGTEDLRPEQSSVHGETVVTVPLRKRLLEWRTLIDTRSDVQNFYSNGNPR